MQNQFMEMDAYFRRMPGGKGRCGHGRGRHGGNPDALDAERQKYGIAQSTYWSQPFSAQDRTLVVLIENGGVDLGIPELVNKLMSALPGGWLVPDGIRQQLVSYIRGALKKATDTLLETAELTLNRYTAAKPDLFGDVVVLRDGTSSYRDLKSTLLSLSRANKVIDLLILTHGSADSISVPGGIDSQKIRDMKTELGKPLTIRSVYMMNCVGSSLNKAWLDAGAGVSSGALNNNYLPEPTMFFFWSKWKSGETFEAAATGAYRKTVGLMNDVVRGFIRTLSIPGASALEAAVDFANFDFVKDSAPVVQGKGTLTINSDDLSVMHSLAAGLAVTVLPASTLAQLGRARALSTAALMPLGAAGINLIKQAETFHPKPYDDAFGNCRVGYGTLLHTGLCDGRPAEQQYVEGISEEEATRLLLERAKEVQQAMNGVVRVPLNQNQNDALVSFLLNVSLASFEKSTLLRLLNTGKYEAVPDELRKWCRARKNGSVVELPELARRRAAEAELFSRVPTAPADGAAVAKSLSALDYSVPGILPILAQPTPRTCWAAVFTMMYSWKKRVSISIPNALATIGPKYVDMFNRDIALDVDSAKVLYQDAGLEPIYSLNPTIEGWEGLLRKYGPLYVDVGYNTPNSGTHAIIVTGISGDGSPEGTTMAYVDPIGGRSVKLKFSEFLAKYEAKTAVEWPYTIVHWPVGDQSTQNSLPVSHSYSYESPSAVVTAQSNFALAQNPAAAVIAGIEVADAAQIGLGAVAVVQAQVSASQGSFTLSYDKAQRLLTNEARSAMPGAQTSKQSYSRHLLHLSIGAINAAEADIIVVWEGNPYGEIGTAVFRRNLATSTDWSKSSANVSITKIDRIPLPQTDPRTWPIVYTYEGTYDPYGNGYFEFSGEFEINAFGGLKFNRHEVVSRSLADWAIGGSPEDKVQRGPAVIVPVPAIPQAQIDYLKTRLP